jgi:hypothetical protein
MSDNNIEKQIAEEMANRLLDKVNRDFIRKKRNYNYITAWS